MIMTIVTDLSELDRGNGFRERKESAREIRNKRKRTGLGSIKVGDLC